MNAAHAHLILNHLPVSGFLIAIPILMIAGWKKNELLGRVGMSIVVMISLVMIPTFLTGEPAEELIEHLPGVSESFIEAHEEAAEKAIWFVGASGLAALAGLLGVFRKFSIPGGALPWVTLISLCAAGFLAWTNNLGGEIRHPEIRENPARSLPGGGGVIDPWNE